MGAEPRPVGGGTRWVSTGLLLILIGAGLGLLSGAPAQEGARRHAVVLEVRGAIGPATADYVGRGLRRAADGGAAIIVLSIDTPGGLDTSMRQIIQAIIASPVPVAAFVNPSGARAASAGTYILYASHVAAMAPGTNLGAATPISLGGGFPFGGSDDDDKDKDKDAKEAAEKKSPTAPKDAGEAKAINDAVAYLRALAELRGRNADWAEKAVREAASLSSADALKEGVIDLRADSVDALLAAIDGRTVKVGGNETRLATAGLAVETAEPDWRSRLLAVITNPNIALLLMTIGVYGLLLEFFNPGSLFPGTVGAISLLVGLYALAILPVNLAGAGLAVLGLAMIVAELFIPSLGALGIGGAVALALGLTILIDTDLPEFEVAWPAVAAVVVASLAFILLVVPIAWRALRGKVVTGAEDMIGAVARVVDWQDGGGHVFLRGERWRATSSGALREGDRVRVTGREGLTIMVEPAASGGPERRTDP